ncbi:MAG: FAD-dependent oxidoreductase [Aestuariivita sp.]|nr:FAD-dependent oxidoreductase [Aestuariivita sp.]
MICVAPTPSTGFDLDVSVLVIGAGASGMVAALSANDAGSEVLVVEADPAPGGSTALSAGLIPAAGTYFQKAAGIRDNPLILAADIQHKANWENSQTLVDTLAANAGSCIEWLSDRFHLPFSVVTDFDYPGHSRRRMHGLPTRAGRELVDWLRSACEAECVDIVCNRRARVLFRDSTRIMGVEVQGPEGCERIGCEALILACNGFGGNREMIARYIPEVEKALWFGHDGNKGDAVMWGDALGAESLHLGAYQGHGNVATPHGILITWAVITEGGVQVNTTGRRFWDESQGYSEAARVVMAQPGGIAWTIFDNRIAEIARQFQDFRDAEAAGALRTADTLDALADLCDLSAQSLNKTISAISSGQADEFGRTFISPGLTQPYMAVKVIGALFHTQGGLNVNQDARVKLANGDLLPNLYASGGAAVGVSGTGDSGYLSGNGLLSAVVLGRIAGQRAAEQT